MDLTRCSIGLCLQSRSSIGCGVYLSGRGRTSGIGRGFHSRGYMQAVKIGFLPIQKTSVGELNLREEDGTLRRQSWKRRLTTHSTVQAGGGRFGRDVPWKYERCSSQRSWRRRQLAEGVGFSKSPGSCWTRRWLTSWSVPWFVISV